MSGLRWVGGDMQQPGSPQDCLTDATIAVMLKLQGMKHCSWAGKAGTLQPGCSYTQLTTAETTMCPRKISLSIFISSQNHFYAKRARSM